MCSRPKKHKAPAKCGGLVDNEESNRYDRAQEFARDWVVALTCCTKIGEQRRELRSPHKDWSLPVFGSFLPAGSGRRPSVPVKYSCEHFTSRSE